MGKNEKGFSLFELMIVIAIISILSVIAVPNFLTWRASSNLRGSAFNLKSDMQMAKLRAIKEGRNVVMKFDDSGSYEIFVDDKEGSNTTDNNLTRDSGEVLVLARKLDGIKLTSAFLGAAANNKVTGFTNRGMVMKDGATEKTGTVTLAVNNKTIQVKIDNKLGLISIN